MHFPLKPVSVLVACALFAGCHRPPPPAAGPGAADIARQLDTDMRRISDQAARLAAFTTDLYARRDAIIPTIDTRKYTFAANGAYYKPDDDGGAALWISGFVPVTPAVQAVAWLTEPLDPELIRVRHDFPAVCQAYFNSRDSLNRIYPWFDTLAQYPPRMNIPEFNFYYLADAIHDPARRPVWVDEPYVDPAGRGWTVSALAPVYQGDTLQGVIGLDVTVATLTNHYFTATDRALAIIARNGVIVAATDRAIQLLEMPPLKDHKYLETVKLDTFKPEEYNLRTSTLRPVRAAAGRILDQHLGEIPVTLVGQPCIARTTAVPELGWIVVEFTAR